jgi:hypothetical protein
MSTDEPRKKPAGNPVTKLFGAMLMAIGGLIATLCGLCSLGFMGFGVFGAFSQGGGVGALGMIPIALLAGAIPVGIGVALFVVGRSLYRNA